MIVVGVDPGLKGALAFFEDRTLFQAIDMPTYSIKSGKSNKNFVSPVGVHQVLDGMAIDCVWLEKVHAMPGQGVSSMFNFGMGYGILLGVIASLGIPVNHVTPQKWKKALNVPAGKDGARKRASELLPSAAYLWPLKKHDGRAEAALIAYYGSRQ